ncbi:hypothetical protein DICPUDRAFT_89878 [Dictyostelium purpureum]|uniref:Response regulatory domain-containing protein n=1 Tax=Dictyostelium purpureum TaxID=5786 RepID=F0ZYS3_DICPU|nr:uncharacterized protein DICPUDRAFT_89878 [Dictyostelium purpureum]EGC30901.1 hypothetical protein DICPUDRAFT_89878 [Dictyostelium purpureum]|eukprot:XP_003292574.1 hypothetical protein DICPUDRAFT_89878 [Dictyostelium purpureum]
MGDTCSIKGANILVVEDDPLNRIIALKFLKKLGHNVTLAENGLHAFNLVSCNTFDLILMDVNMPVMDGKESTKKIREYESRVGKRTPIIGLTTMPKDECIEAGMDDHLFKPAKFNLLDEKVTYYLKNQAYNQSISAPEKQEPSSEPSSPTVTIKSDIQIVSINNRNKYISSPDLLVYFKNISNINTNVNSLSSSCNNICTIKEINEENIEYLNQCNINNNNLTNIKNCNSNQCNNNNNNNNNENINCIFNNTSNNNIYFVNTDLPFLNNNNNVLSNINNIKNLIQTNTTLNNSNNNNSILNRRRKFVSRSTSQPSFFSNKEYTVK